MKKVFLIQLKNFAYPSPHMYIRHKKYERANFLRRRNNEINRHTMDQNSIFIRKRTLFHIITLVYNFLPQNIVGYAVDMKFRYMVMIPHNEEKIYVYIVKKLFYSAVWGVGLVFIRQKCYNCAGR